MNFKIYIQDSSGKIKAQAQGDELITLVYENPYTEGDSIFMESSEPGFVVAQLEDSIPPVIGYLASPYNMQVPFGSAKEGHSPKNFSGSLHLLSLRKAEPCEIKQYRNLAFNPLDCHENSGFFPHAYANVETRGESVFAARNAINGNYANNSHGPWPYESWGINRRADAEITIDFGRQVEVDCVVITLRADFPHDNWWKKARIEFSDGSFELLEFSKTRLPQRFCIKPRNITWAKMLDMKKDESDPSPFPALTQIEFWGVEK